MNETILVLHTKNKCDGIGGASAHGNQETEDDISDVICDQPTGDCKDDLSRF